MLCTSWCLVVVHPSFCNEVEISVQQMGMPQDWTFTTIQNSHKKRDTYDDAFDCGFYFKTSPYLKRHKTIFLGGWFRKLRMTGSSRFKIQVLIKSALGTLWNNGCFLCRRHVLFLKNIQILPYMMISYQFILTYIISYHFISYEAISYYHIIS